MFNFYAPDRSDVVEASVIDRSVKHLKRNAKTISDYATRFVAHHDAYAPARWFSFQTVDAAVDEIGEVIQFYYPLRNPGIALGAVEPIKDLSMMKMFERPWFPPGSLLG